MKGLLILLTSSLISFSAISSTEANFNFELLQSKTFQKQVIRRGQVEYLNNIVLSFKTSGYIEELNVDVGDQINSNNSVATLEASELVYKAQALTYRLEFVGKEQTRIGKLFKDGLVPKSALDSINAEYDQLNENLKEITYLLLRTKLYPEVNGVVSERFVNNGELVAAGQPVLSYAPQNNNVVATFYLPEKEFQQLKQDQPVNLTLLLTAMPLTGIVTRMAVLPNSAGLYRVDIALEGNVLAGSNIELNLNISNEQVFAVSHHTPVSINANTATVLLREGQNITQHQMSVVSMDDDYIYLQTNRRQAEFVTNGWISR